MSENDSMTDTPTFPSKEAETSVHPQNEKKIFDSASILSERSKLSGASFLKIPSEPDAIKPVITNPPEKAPAPEKAEEEKEAARKAEEERLRLEEEQIKAKQKAEAEARREMTAAQIQAKIPRNESDMQEELEMLTSAKNLTPSQIGVVLQWLIKQEILHSERIKNLQKEISKLLPKE